MQTFDFSRSFLRFRVDLDAQEAITLSNPSPLRVNNARIALEATCELIHRPSGKTTLYALGASCKSELVGVERDIWTQPNADFCLVASIDEALIIKRWDRTDKRVMRFPETLGVQPERQVDLVSCMWNSFDLSPHVVEGKLLESSAEVIEAVFANRPLNLRLAYDDRDYHVTIQHPVKTMNVNELDGLFQTDTGPIALPNLSPTRRAIEQPMVSVFDLAYVAFKDPDWAEFIVNVPTRLTDEINVHHYSETRRIEKMKNAIIEVR